MRISFVVPFVNLTGGIRVVLGYANWLHDTGHDVRVIYPLWPYRFHFDRRQQAGEFRKAVHERATIDWYDLRCPLLRVPIVHDMFLPDADVIVGTSWPVMADLASVRARRGVKVQLLFHHETGTGPEDRIRKTYRAPFYRITFARSISRELEQHFACRIDAELSAGIETSQFFPDGRPSASSVVMLYHDDPRKGAEDGLRALTMLHASRPDVRIHMCGTVRPPELPRWIDFTMRPTDAQLRQMLSTASVLLYPSRYEGFGLPPLEAMACGCPVVTTAVGAVPEYAIHGSNAWIVAPGDVTGMFSGLTALLSDHAFRSSMSAQGLSCAARYSIAAQAPIFGAALQAARNPVELAV